MKKKQELIIHLGMHKTGSTSIQETLANNSCGDEYTYLNLGAINHNHRVYSLFSGNPAGYYLNKGKSKIEIDNFNAETRKLFRDCVESIETPKAIISGEDLINLNEKELFEMNDFFKSFFEIITVFAYVREPVSYMNSLLQQVIKSGVGFERFISENDLENSPVLSLGMLYPNYKELFKKHERVFGEGNLLLKLFDRSSLIEGNVVVDFIRSFNIPIGNEGVVNDNESISKPALSIIYVLRKASLNSVIDITQQALGAISSSMHLLKGEKLVLSSEAYKELVFNNSEDIVWLKEKLSESFIDYGEKRDGVSSEEDLVKISEEDFSEFSYLLEKTSVEADVKDKVVKVVESVCLHGDLNKISKKITPESIFGDLTNKIRPNHEVADILREVAYKFEKCGDIDTACKVMEQAHLLRPKGPFIKQKLEAYHSILNEKTAPAIPPEGIETINALGHRDYVGGLWEELGQLQFEFMVAQGLQPEHTLLDIACGSLRGGVHFINYLNPGNYLGLDKEQALINRGIEQELGKGKLAEKQPQFVINDHFEFDKFSKAPDYAIAQSLFTHLVEKDIRLCLENLKKLAGDKPLTFYATFLESNAPHLNELETSHSLVSFEYTRQKMEQFGRDAGWEVDYIGNWGHPRGQKMIKYSLG